MHDTKGTNAMTFLSDTLFTHLEPFARDKLGLVQLEAEIKELPVIRIIQLLFNIAYSS